MMLDRRGFLIGAGGSLAAAHAARAQAPGWPTRAVKIIVPVAAGTATDITARVFGERLAPRWGQPVVVENKPGADGLIALGSFVAGRDDHTLLFSFSTAVSLNPMIHEKLPYDPAIDLVPVTTTSEVLFGIAAHRGLGTASLGALAALAQAQPGKLNWAAAPGLPRFVLERHFRERNLDLAYVGYQQTNAAVTDLGEGRLQVMIASLGTLWPVVEANKAKVVVIAAEGRAAMLPEVPSAIEAGFPDLAVPAVGCVYGWKGMTPTLRDRLAADIDRAAQDAGLVAQLGRVGQSIRRSTPGDLAALLARQRVELEPLAKLIVERK
jgi:tripartite-type tricarboxylate transporter receptor subunit TctC